MSQKMTSGFMVNDECVSPTVKYFRPQFISGHTPQAKHERTSPLKILAKEIDKTFCEKEQYYSEEESSQQD
jgi:hypothetical protein